MKPRHVFVRWHDITSRTGWVSKDDARKAGAAASVWSCGFVISDTKKHIILAQDLSDDGEVNGRETIPRGCVLQVLENEVPFNREEENV